MWVHDGAVLPLPVVVLVVVVALLRGRGRDLIGRGVDALQGAAAQVAAERKYIFIFVFKYE